jgi:hypothetical protein
MIDMIVYRNNSLSLVYIYYNKSRDKKFLKYLNRLNKGVEVFIKKAEALNLGVSAILFWKALCIRSYAH